MQLALLIRSLAILSRIAPGVALLLTPGAQVQAQATGKRLTPLEAQDLARLTDIGSDAPEDEVHFLSLSPDRRRVAFQTQQADPAANDYHLTLVVMDVRAGAAPIIVDEGGQLIRKSMHGVGGVPLQTGSPATMTPRWSSDGNTLYFLKKTDGSAEVWTVKLDGSKSKRLTSDAGDVDDFILSEDGKRIIYESITSDPVKLAGRAAEALSGYHYDQRFIPIFSDVPMLAPTTTTLVRSLDIASGKTDSASETDKAALASFQAIADAPAVSISPRGDRAWVVQPADAVRGVRTELHAIDADGTARTCLSPMCSGAGPLWWTLDGKEVRYIRREGWGASETAMYEWTPGAAEPVRLYATSDLLLDCQPVGDQALCAREQSLAPRHIVLIDPRSGQEQQLYDPNPDFGEHRLGRVERLHWRNAFGIKSFGDLVYPVGYQAGQAYPLIVVQYVSRGFFRGGTGDEFPIQLFANHGYAVLSIQRPSQSRLIPGAHSMRDMERQMLSGFKDRRSVLSSIERAVRQLIRRGIADKDRIGITGLSDGSSTVQFAAINSKLFKAGSVSGCCWERSQDALVGPTVANAYHQIGWPPLSDEAPEFWRRISIVKNARRVALPLLIQQADQEYKGVLESYTALRQMKKPAALFIFPGEFHIKWQPAHRLAIYERNLRWFDYWLRGIGDSKEWIEEAGPQ